MPGFNGGPTDDEIDGTSGIDSIFGYAAGDFGPSGDDILRGLAGDDNLYGGDGHDQLFGGDDNDRLSGQAGDDELYGDSGNDRLAGADGNDYLFGGDGDDILYGSLGDDVIEGGAGADILHGGPYRSDIDTVSYMSSDAAVTINLNGGVQSGGHAEGDVFTHFFVSAIGSAFDDVIIAGLRGIPHFLEGGPGADYLEGGLARNTSSYAHASAGVTVNMTTGVHTGDAEGDVFVRIANLRGSAHGDDLTGDNHQNVLEGMYGDDILNGAGNTDRLYGGEGDDVLLGGNHDDFLYGDAGSDTLDGGAGYDTADYSAATTALVVGVNVGAINSGDLVDGDTLFSIENLTGSTFDDMLTGNNNYNVLTGNNGNDTLNGGGREDQLFGGSGDDYLIGGSGADIVNGGQGIDTASYVNAGAAVTVNMTTGIVTGADQGTGDTLIQIEIVVGSMFDDTITGRSPFNGYINGYNGNDTITGSGSLLGGNGNDVIRAQGGIGILVGGAGDDQLFGGLERDSLSGGQGDDIMDGGLERDTFDYNLLDFGHDTINAWQDGLDTIDFRGLGLTFASLTISQVGADAVLIVDGDAAHSITLVGIASSSIGANDFLF